MRFQGAVQFFILPDNDSAACRRWRHRRRQYRPAQHVVDLASYLSGKLPRLRLLCAHRTSARETEGCEDGNERRTAETTDHGMSSGSMSDNAAGVLSLLRACATTEWWHDGKLRQGQHRLQLFLASDELKIVKRS